MFNKTKTALFTMVMVSTFKTFAQQPHLVYRPVDAYDLTTGTANNMDSNGSEVAVLSINNTITGVDMHYNLDGLTAYVLGRSTGIITEYTGTTPYDPATLTATGVVFDTGFPDASAFVFSDDGSILFVAQSAISGRTIQRFDVATPFNLGGTVTLNPAVAYDASGTVGAIGGMDVSPDGSKFYLIEIGLNQVYQFTMATPFMPATVTAPGGGIFGPVAAVSNNRGDDVFWQPGGGTMYTYTRSGSSRVGIYEAVIPYDMSSFTGPGVEKRHGTINTMVSGGPAGIAFTPDGTHMVIVGNLGFGLAQVKNFDYVENTANDGSINNPPDMVTISIVDAPTETFSNAGGILAHGVDYTIANIPSGLTPVLTVATDGKSAALTLAGNASPHFDTVDVNHLEIAFANSAFTGGNASALLFSGTPAMPKATSGVDFFGTRTLTYTLPTTQSDNIGYTGNALDYTPESMAAASLDVTTSPFGSQFYYLTDAPNETIHLFFGNENIASANSAPANFAYDLKTAVPTANNIVDHHFNNDGSKLFIVDGSSPNTIREFTLPAPYFTNNVVYSGASEEFSSAEVSTITAFQFNADGTKLFVASANTIYRYSITAFDISTAVYDGAANNLVVNATVGSINTFAFNAAGTRLFVGNTTSSDLYAHTLGTAFDNTTAVFDGAIIDASNETPGIRAVDIAVIGGASFYIVGTDTSIYQYSAGALVYPEATVNNGTLNNTNPIVITLDQEVFQDTDANNRLEIGSQLTIGNVPDGLRPVATISGAGTVLTITFDDTANFHSHLDDVTNLTFQFTDAAFRFGDAATVTNSGNPTPYNTNVGIDFFGGINYARHGKVVANGMEMPMSF